jgi:hypothetical protein
MQLDPGGIFARPGADLVLTISSYHRDTPEAQITILLHELEHIIGRLPEDDDSWDGRSSDLPETVVTENYVQQFSTQRNIATFWSLC